MLASQVISVTWNIDYLKRDKLVNMLRDKNQTDKYQIIDVREADYVGGHIIGSVNIPYKTMELKWPQFIKTYHNVPLIIFHCMYSEVRGPAAYQRYTFLTDSIIKLFNKKKQKLSSNNSNYNNTNNADDLKQNDNNNSNNITIRFQTLEFSLNDTIITHLSKQKCVVLEGGFSAWVVDCIKDDTKLNLMKDFNKQIYTSNK